MDRYNIAYKHVYIQRGKKGARKEKDAEERGGRRINSSNVFFNGPSSSAFFFPPPLLLLYFPLHITFLCCFFLIFCGCALLLLFSFPHPTSPFLHHLCYKSPPSPTYIV